MTAVASNATEAEAEKDNEGLMNDYANEMRAEMHENLDNFLITLDEFGFENKIRVLRLCECHNESLDSLNYSISLSNDTMSKIYFLLIIN